MTLRLEMLRAVRSARSRLREAAPTVREFLAGQVNPDGGFRGRADASDLYYTVFGLEGFLALGGDPPALLPEWLRGFGAGEGLDFVHLASLARIWADCPGEGLNSAARRELAERIEAYRADDGGYSHVAEAPHGTAYGAFLAVGALEDLDAAIPDAEALADSLGSLRTAKGGYANAPGSPGLTPATAAAATLLRHLERPVGPEPGRWLLDRAAPRGGFVATIRSPVPDLLSTATALHALAALGVPPGAARQQGLEFLGTVWSEEEGGFRAHVFDERADCEYTWYGLLALGHLGE